MGFQFVTIEFSGKFFEIVACFLNAVLQRFLLYGAKTVIEQIANHSPNFKELILHYEIRTPQDMVGRTIATQPTAQILLRALLAKNGIAEDQVEVVNMGSDMNQLMTGQAAAVTGWMTNTNALKILGEDRVDLMLWDTGIQLYANVYYTTDDMLDDHSDVLANYLGASARGWGYARDNPEEAVDMLVSAYPNLDRDSELAAVGPVLGFSFNETTASEGWGAMNRENWQNQIDIYAELGQFQGEVPGVDDVMSMSILEATADARPLNLELDIVRVGLGDTICSVVVEDLSRHPARHGVGILDLLRSEAIGVVKGHLKDDTSLVLELDDVVDDEVVVQEVFDHSA